MKRPLTRVLTKLVANGFYQAHTGLLLSLFVAIFVNFFYTTVLNQTHLTQEGIIQNALKLVLTSVSEPLGAMILFSLCFIYSMRSWQYVAGRLKEVDVQFLFYSSNALSWAQQFQSWIIIQFVISIPIIIIGLFSTIVGFAFGYWIIPLLIPLYLLALILFGASYYTRQINETSIESIKSVKYISLKNWPKPIFSLFLFEVATKKRIAFGITKLASAVSIAIIFSIFSESHTDIRLYGILSLFIALAHVILIYQSNEFELFYLRFARNFPHSHWQLYSQQALMYSLLLLPEIVWLVFVGRFVDGLISALLMISTALLFRNLLYWIGQRMDFYLRSVFGLLIFFLLTILFGFTELLAVSNLVDAWLLLYQSQYEARG